MANEFEFRLSFRLLRSINCWIESICLTVPLLLFVSRVVLRLLASERDDNRFELVGNIYYFLYCFTHSTRNHHHRSINKRYPLERPLAQKSKSNRQISWHVRRHGHSRDTITHSHGACTCVPTYVWSRSDRRRGARLLFIPGTRHRDARSPHFRRMRAAGLLAAGRATLSDGLGFHWSGRSAWPHCRRARRAHHSNFMPFRMLSITSMFIK